MGQQANAMLMEEEGGNDDDDDDADDDADDDEAASKNRLLGAGITLEAPGFSSGFDGTGLVK